MHWVIRVLVAASVSALVGVGIRRAMTRKEKPHEEIKAVAKTEKPSSLESAAAVFAPGLLGAGQAGAPKDPEIRVLGFALMGQKINVVLSDGRTLTERDRELEKVERNSATISGKKYFLVSARSVAVPKQESKIPEVIYPEVVVKPDPVKPVQPVSAPVLPIVAIPKREVHLSEFEREAYSRMSDPIHGGIDQIAKSK